MTKTDTEPTGQIYDDGAKPNMDLDELERKYNEPAAEYPEGHPSEENDDDKIKDLEDSFSGPSATPNDMPSGHPDLYKSSIKSKSKVNITGKLKKNRVSLYIIGGISSTFLIIIIIFFLMSILKIPNYAANIAGYRMARSAHEFAKNTARIDAAKMNLDSKSDKSYKETIDKYKNSELLKKVGYNYRPKLIYQNLKESGRYSYETTKVKRFGITTEKITKIVIDGKSYELSQKRFGNFLQNYRNRINFVAAVNAHIDQGLKTHNTLVRGSVAKKIRAQLNIKLSWWEKAAAKYKGKKASEALKLQLQEETERVATRPNTEPVTQGLRDAKNEYIDAQDECIKSAAECADEMTDGKHPKKLSEKLKDVVSGFEIKGNLIGAASNLYAIASVLCLIIDGSLEHSGGDIDAITASNQKAEYELASAADQQKSGDTNGEAVGALNHKLGSGDSVPDQYMRGINPETNPEKSPEMSIGGDFTLLNALFPDNGAMNIVSNAAVSFCPTLTNPVTGIVAGVTEIVATAVAAVFTGGGSVAAEGAVKATISQVIKYIFTKAFLKAVIKEIGSTVKEKILTWGFAKKFARDFILIEGATILAKLVVLHKAGMINDARSSTNGNFKNAADAGFVAENNQYMQKIMYARPMTNSETTNADEPVVRMAYDREKFKNPTERYFAFDNPRSLFGIARYKILDIKNSGLIKYFSSLNINNILNNFLPNKGLVFAADANTNSYYYTVQWGWTIQEDKKIDNDETYDIFENEYILKNSKIGDQEAIPKIEEEYGECWSSTMGTLLSEGKIVRDENGNVIENKGKCSPENLSFKNKNGFGELVFRYRKYKRDINNIDHLLGIQNPAKTSSPATEQDCDTTGSSNKNLFMIGDSLTNGMKSEGKIEEKLKTAGWNPTVIAQDGKGIAWGQEQLKSNQQAVQDAGTIVVALGTNDGASPNFKALYDDIKTINPSAKVYWVNFVGVMEPSATNLIKASASLAEFASKNNITVINWAAIGTPYAKNDKAMGIHPYGNYDKMADLVLQSLESSGVCSETSPTGWVWPVKKEDLDNKVAGLNQCWMKYNTDMNGHHAALDINVSDTPVYAAKDGTVIRRDNSIYHIVVIEHPGSPKLYSVYMHMNGIPDKIKEGYEVKAGEKIGIASDAGSKNSGPHLHFGISTSGSRFGTYDDPWATVNPLDYLPNDYSPALLKDDNTGSCLTKDIKGKSDFGIPDDYRINNGADKRYYQ